MSYPRVTPATAQHPKNLQAGLTYAPPYHLYTKAVYVDNPYTLNFPERMCGALAKTFILSKEYDAEEHAFRFISGVSHNKLYGWTMGGTCRVRITYNTCDPMRRKVERLP